MNKKKKNCDLSKLLKPYANKWVALSSNKKKILASGNQLKDIIAKIKTKDVIFTKVFPEKSFYMPYQV